MKSPGFSTVNEMEKLAWKITVEKNVKTTISIRCGFSKVLQIIVNSAVRRQLGWLVTEINPTISNLYNWGYKFKSPILFLSDRFRALVEIRHFGIDPDGRAWVSGISTILPRNSRFFPWNLPYSIIKNVKWDHPMPKCN